MQKLHLVGFTTDHRGLIFSVRRGARSGSFLLEVDDALLDAIDAVREHLEADVAAHAGEAPGAGAGEAAEAARPESALSVREVQARLRAGATIDEVAAAAGVDPDWVARFAPPVLAEQARMVEAAQAATLTRPKLGPSALPLGDAVRVNLAARSGRPAALGPDPDAWSARLLADGTWEVALRTTVRGRTLVAAWRYDPTTGALAAAGRRAAELGYVAPGSPAARTGRSRTSGAPNPGTRTRGTARVAAARREAEERLARQAAARAERAARARPARPVPQPPARPARSAPPSPDRRGDPGSGDERRPPAGTGDAGFDGGSDAGLGPLAAALAEVRAGIERELADLDRRLGRVGTARADRAAGTGAPAAAPPAAGPTGNGSRPHPPPEAAPGPAPRAATPAPRRRPPRTEPLRARR